MSREPFDLLGPLPWGTSLVLEASAGTGKTYTIAALAARYVAEGRCRLPDIMLVTFSGASTRELRDRIRGRLGGLAESLRARLASPHTEPADDVTALLTTGTDEEVAARLVRIDDALADFDNATICTTHQFCTRMLTEVGFLADHEPTTQVREDISDFVQQAAADEYLSRYHRATRTPFSYADARLIATKAVAFPDLPLAPLAGSDLDAERVAFAAAIRERVEARKRSADVYTYDDMAARLVTALQHPETGELAAERLRARFPVVLVDEFQDTDPLQWQIIRTAFSGHSTVVLIGDPKQSIYGFRGADVQAYLAAVNDSEVRVLDTNRRTRPELVRAVGALFDGAQLGDERIVVEDVRTTPPTTTLEVGASAPWATPLRIRVSEKENYLQARIEIDDDLAGDVAALLSSDATITTPAGTRGIRPHDLAVIVWSNKRGQRIADALSRVGVPSVFTGARSVMTTAAALDWHKLLTAFENPGAKEVKAAALTDLVGWSFARLATATDDDLATLIEHVRRWAALLDEIGVAGLLSMLEVEHGLARRVLAAENGERVLTDLRHVAEILHAAGRADNLKAAGLRAWLDERIARSRATRNDDRSRRLETDSDVVSVLTVHQAKGLEFPVVYLPELMNGARQSDPVFAVHDDSQSQTMRVLDVGAPSRAHHERENALRKEEAGEDLRKLYVALTRAKCHVTAWWAPVYYGKSSAFQRLLLKPPGTREPPVEASVSPGQLDDVKRLTHPGILMSMTTAGGPAPRVKPAEAGAEPWALDARRRIDQTWRRTSYSALTAAAHDAHMATLAGALDDEPALPENAFPPDPEAIDAALPVGTGGGSADALDTLSPMGELPGGVAFGSLVHAVFENYDPAADPGDALATIVAAQTSRMPVAGVSADDLTAALRPGLHTPLGSLTGGRALSDIPATDRLAELDFEVPLGSDSDGATITAIADLLDRHLTADDPLIAYGETLRDPVFAADPLRGFLTGSIDAVLRVDGRFLIVDYKTNRLAPPGEALTLGHYTAGAMAQAMISSHYPLQALLYAVALHRMLRWRLAGYRPEQHLGPIGYLFVRGLAGPDTPVVDGMPCGVFTWHPPAALVEELSDLLAGRPLP